MKGAPSSSLAGGPKKDLSTNLLDVERLRIRKRPEARNCIICEALSGPTLADETCQACGFFLSTAHSQRLVNVKSRLKQAPRYSTLDRDLIEYQERQLFEYFVVVSLHKKQAGAAYVPELTQQFPLKVGEAGPYGLPGDCHILAVSLDAGR